MKSSITRVLLTALLGFSLAGLAHAQKRYTEQYPAYGDSSAYVTVFEDCDFRGKSRALTVGDYQNVRDLSLGNDSISSVQVPAGMSLVLFEHERLGGKSTIISSDIRCLNREWDNEASSLRVSADGNYNQGRRPFDGRSNQNVRDGSRGPNLTAGVSYVAFANSALEQTRGQQWRIVNSNGSVDNFREVGRDKEVISLRNERINQNVTINLRTQQVVFVQPNGKSVNYRIDSTQAQNRNRGVRSDRGATETGVINGSCFNYRAYTRGGTGGIRFHGHDGFERFSKRPQTDRICHDGPLTMELSKTDPGTDVVVDINGRSYRFAPNEQADAYLNSWYRKKIRLQVGR